MDQVNQQAIMPVAATLMKMSDAAWDPHDVLAHVQFIRALMETVMRVNVHYGTIPGTNKPTLLKPGSDIILMACRITARLNLEDLSTPEYFRIRARALGIHQITGAVVGEGVGECSGAEDKYMWRKVVAGAEYEAARVDQRRMVWRKQDGGSRVVELKQVRNNPHDLANTVMKMAAKRARIDLTLACTAASEVFTQDMEEDYTVDAATAPPAAAGGYGAASVFAVPPVPQPAPQAGWTYGPDGQRAARLAPLFAATGFTNDAIAASLYRNFQTVNVSELSSEQASTLETLLRTAAQKQQQKQQGGA